MAALAVGHHAEITAAVERADNARLQARREEADKAENARLDAIRQKERDEQLRKEAAEKIRQAEAAKKKKEQLELANSTELLKKINPAAAEAAMKVVNDSTTADAGNKSSPAAPIDVYAGVDRGGEWRERDADGKLKLLDLRTSNHCCFGNISIITKNKILEINPEKLFAGRAVTAPDGTIRKLSCR